VRRALRVTALCVIGFFEVIFAGIAVVTWDNPGAEFGWNIATDGVTVMSVEPNLPAANAGIVAGDKVVYSTMPLPGRINTLMNQALQPGATISFRIVHDGTERAVTMQARSFTSLAAASLVADAIGGLALGLVGLALVALRPSPMTWGFALVAPPLLVPEALYLRSGEWAFAPAFAFYIVVSVLYALQILGTLVFASGFPTGASAGFARTVARLAIPAAIGALAIYCYVDFAIFASGVAPARWALWVNSYGATVAGAILALVAMFSNYAAAERANRSRLAPVIAAFVLLTVATVLEQFVWQVTSNPVLVGLGELLFAISSALLAASIAYGVVRHRVIDVGFIISRTLVYTILTVFIVAVFSLIEYVFGKLLEHEGVATLLEIASAVGLGLWLNVLHAKLDDFIDRTIFRKRHLAEKRLEAASQTLPHASSTSFVDDMLVAEPVDALELASAAVFRRDGAAFRRESAKGWSPGDVTELEENDHLVVRLRAELQPVEISDLRWPREDLPKGMSQPLYAVPIASGHNLAAIALYGGHTGGEDLDPDERRSLRGLAAGAALAYDHLAAQELNRTVEELRGENEALRRSQDVLVEKVLKRLI
jgi:hypothetical protein